LSRGFPSVKIRVSSVAAFLRCASCASVVVN
jgi:hypothetical protein